MPRSSKGRRQPRNPKEDSIDLSRRDFLRKALLLTAIISSLPIIGLFTQPSIQTTLLLHIEKLSKINFPYLTPEEFDFMKGIIKLFIGQPERIGEFLTQEGFFVGSNFNGGVNFNLQTAQLAFLHFVTSPSQHLSPFQIDPVQDGVPVIPLRKPQISKYAINLNAGRFQNNPNTLIWLLIKELSGLFFVNGESLYSHMGRAIYAMSQPGGILNSFFTIKQIEKASPEDWEKVIISAELLSVQFHFPQINRDIRLNVAFKDIMSYFFVIMSGDDDFIRYSASIGANTPKVLRDQLVLQGLIYSNGNGGYDFDPTKIVNILIAMCVYCYNNPQYLSGGYAVEG